MMLKKVIIVITALGLMAAAACSNNSSGISTTPATSASPSNSVTSFTPTGTVSLQVPVSGVQKAGTLRVWLVTIPAPLKPGNGVLDVYVVDAGGQAVDDAVLTYSINMTNMNMGNNVTKPGLVGSGHYSKTVRFSMAGPWRLTVTIVRGGQTNTVAFDFTVTY